MLDSAGSRAQSQVQTAHSQHQIIIQVRRNLRRPSSTTPAQSMSNQIRLRRTTSNQSWSSPRMEIPQPPQAICFNHPHFRSTRNQPCCSAFNIPPDFATVPLVTVPFPGSPTSLTENWVHFEIGMLTTMEQESNQMLILAQKSWETMVSVPAT